MISQAQFKTNINNILKDLKEMLQAYNPSVKEANRVRRRLVILVNRYRKPTPSLLSGATQQEETTLVEDANPESSIPDLESVSVQEGPEETEEEEDGK
jgi:hypothetical protein